MILAPAFNPNTQWEQIDVDSNLDAQLTDHAPTNILNRIVKSTAEVLTTAAPSTSSTPFTTESTTVKDFITTTTEEITKTTKSPFFETNNIIHKFQDLISATTPAPEHDHPGHAFNDDSGEEITTQGGFAALFNIFTSSTPSTTTQRQSESLFGNPFESISNLRTNFTNNIDHDFESLDSLFPQSLVASSTISPNATSCGRINIMGTIVQDSAPYLYPFIIEYSLIGAVVIYVMWKHIGRYPKYTNEEDLEHRLEVMLSRRAVALAQANSGRVDCVGSSKGLFFGLLLLVGSLICLILFFVLIQTEKFMLLAIRLADISHGVLLVFAILSILIGFIRYLKIELTISDIAIHN